MKSEYEEGGATVYSVLPDLLDHAFDVASPGLVVGWNSVGSTPTLFPTLNRPTTFLFAPVSALSHS